MHAIYKTASCKKKILYTDIYMLKEIDIIFVCLDVHLFWPKCGRVMAFAKSPFMARSFQRALLAARQSCQGRRTSTPTTPPGRTGRLMGPPGSVKTVRVSTVAWHCS